MKQRVITAACILAVAIPVFVFSWTPAYCAVLAVLSVLAQFELLRVLGLCKKWLIAAPAYLLSLAMPVGAYLYIYVFSRPATGYLLLMALAEMVLLLWLFFVAVLAEGNIPFADIAQVFAGVTYVAVAFAALTILRYLPGGEYLFLLVFIAAWISDVFAYFVGFLFGKHKLSPKISPKKTVEGSLGGIAFAVVAFLLYGFLFRRFGGRTPHYPLLAISAVILAVVSQIGDLLTSLIKREHDVKDYGKLFPGHGGVLDRFDSVLAVATVLMIICLVAPPLL